MAKPFKAAVPLSRYTINAIYCECAILNLQVMTAGVIWKNMCILQNNHYLYTLPEQIDQDENGWNWNFQPALWLSSAVEVNSSFIHFHGDLSAPAMSTDMSQVGVALFPSFEYIFYHFTFTGFPSVLIKQFSVSIVIVL